MAAAGVIAADHFPAAASMKSIDVALMGRPGTPAEGTVSSVRGEVIERYDDFLDYYLAMMELSKQETESIRRKDGPSSPRRYSEAIRPSGNPVSSLTLVTNTPESVEFLGQRAREILGPDVELHIQLKP